MGESTTPFDPRGRTRGKPSQLLLDNYKYLEYINIFDSAMSSRQIPQGSTPSADSDATKTV